jgi:hypothetical protein
LSKGGGIELGAESHAKQLANLTNGSVAKVVAFVAKMAMRCRQSGLTCRQSGCRQSACRQSDRKPVRLFVGLLIFESESDN